MEILSLKLFKGLILALNKAQDYFRLIYQIENSFSFFILKNDFPFFIFIFHFPFSKIDF